MKQMVYSRYIKFVGSLYENKRPMIRSLFNKVSQCNDSVTGSNLRTILLDTGVKIEPGVTKGFALANYRVYGGVSADKEWMILFLVSLMEVRDGRCQISFDHEIGDMGQFAVTRVTSFQNRVTCN